MGLKFFQHKIKVEFEDLDANGHATTTKYIDYVERARSAALAARGLTFREFMAQGYGLVIVETSLKFFSPAFLHEDLYVQIRLTDLSKKTMLFDHLVAKEPFSMERIEQEFDSLPKIHSSRTLFVCVDLKTMKSATIPEGIRKYLE